MTAVEWCDIVRYSEISSAFDDNVEHPRCVILTCRALRHHNTQNSWSGNVSSTGTMFMFHSNMGSGLYGMSTDPPYASRNTLGCFLQGDRLN